MTSIEESLEIQNNYSEELMVAVQGIRSYRLMKKVFKEINSLYTPAYPLNAYAGMSPDEREAELSRAYDILSDDIEKNEAAVRDLHAREYMIEEINRLYEARPEGQLLIMTHGDETWTISERTINKIEGYLDMLTEPIVWETPMGSDSDFHYLFFNEPSLEDVEFEYINPRDKSPKSNDGGYFEYANTTKIDLRDLQIYTEEELHSSYDNRAKAEIGVDCLLYALEKTGVPKNLEDLTVHKLYNGNDSHTLSGGLRSLPKSDLGQVAEVLQCCIRLKDIGTNYKVAYNVYGIKYEVKVEAWKTVKNKLKKVTETPNTARIALYLNHYFVDCKMPYTRYSIDNYESINHLPEWNHIVNKSIKRDARYMTANSATIVMALYKQGRLVRKVDLKKQKGCFKVSDYTIPENIDRNFSEYKPKKISKSNTTEYFFDIESTTNETYHKAFLYGYMPLVGVKVSIVNSLYKMLDDIIKRTPPKNNIVLYAHNAKYDYSVGFRPLKKSSELTKDGVFYSAEFYFKKHKFTIKDTYKHVSIPLGSFRSVFGLSIGKKDEFIPYDLYTTETVEKHRIPLERVLEHPYYDESKHLTLIQKYIKGNWFKHMIYMRKYLKYDVLTLRAGFLKQRESIKDVTGLDILDFLTASSLVDHYFAINGCFKGVCEVHGALKTWIMRSVVGGRVVTRENQRYNIKAKIMDFDAVSLYPSAISLLRVPLGIPKVISSLDDMGDNYYIAEIVITAVKKQRAMPFMCYRDSNGGRRWTNDMVGHRVVVDKYTLEDYLEYHEIEYEFLQGISWSRYSSTFAEKMKELFQKRLEAKEVMKTEPERRAYYNMKQSSIKLLMNSAYGKTIIKESNTKIVFLDADKTHNYVVKNYNQIIKYREEPHYTRFVVRDNTFNQANRAHIGTQVLSLSKRIMNQVMATAEDAGIGILYQDTDSMHLPLEDVEKLRASFKLKYDKELVGKKMGQFHNDLENSKGEPCTSVHCIILGKKCYIDKLVSNLEEDPVKADRAGRYEYHIRMKGVGSKTVLANYQDPLKVYERLYNGEALNFDLLKAGVSFKIDSGMTVASKKKFIRRIKF